MLSLEQLRANAFKEAKHIFSQKVWLVYAKPQWKTWKENKLK